jgi:hypothetical protein
MAKNVKPRAKKNSPASGHCIISLSLPASLASLGVGARVTKSVDRTTDQVALATVRTWKFKVSRGEQATFPIKFLYRMSCDSAVD